MRTRTVLSSLIVSLSLSLLAACGHGGSGGTIAAVPAEDFVAPSAGAIQRDEARAVAELLGRSSAALRAGRLIAPAGDNALEWGLKARALAPAHRGVEQQLSDIRPYVASAVDGAIRGGDLTEAERVIGLLEQAGGASLTVHQLRESLRVAVAKAGAADARREAAATHAATAPPASAAIAEVTATP
jgi:protein TonB